MVWVYRGNGIKGYVIRDLDDFVAAVLLANEWADADEDFYRGLLLLLWFWGLFL